MRLFVDTCAWRHWLTLKNNRPFENDVLENYAKEFDRVYGIVSSEPLKHTFLYNARIEGELPDCYLGGLPISFSKIKANSYFEKTAIPLSRADGTYKADGSLLCGGRFGGVLTAILSMDGYDHQRALQAAVPNCKLENPAHTKPRKKEFDVEHLESVQRDAYDFMRFLFYFWSFVEIADIYFVWFYELLETRGPLILPAGAG
jgi:hypothetical protein